MVRTVESGRSARARPLAEARGRNRIGRPRRARDARTRLVVALGCAAGLGSGGVAAQPADVGGSAASRSGDPSGCPATLGVAIERSFARGKGIGVGDRLGVGPGPDGPMCDAVVRAIFEPHPDPARLTLDRPAVRFSFPELARLADRPDAADWFTLGLAPGAVPDSVAARLRASLPGPSVLPTSDVTEEASTTFRVIERFHGAIAWITLVAGGVFLSCIMFLKVGERRGPVSALRLVGISRGTLARWIMLEAALISVLGGALGLALGGVASALVNRFYRAAYDTTLVFSLITPGVLIESIVLALAMGIGAGALATYRLLATDPLTEIGR